MINKDQDFVDYMIDSNNRCVTYCNGRGGACLCLCICTCTVMKYL